MPLSIAHFLSVIYFWLLSPYLLLHLIHLKDILNKNKKALSGNIFKLIRRFTADGENIVIIIKCFKFLFGRDTGTKSRNQSSSIMNDNCKDWSLIRWVLFKTQQRWCVYVLDYKKTTFSFMLDWQQQVTAENT